MNHATPPDQGAEGTLRYSAVIAPAARERDAVPVTRDWMRIYSHQHPPRAQRAHATICGDYNEQADGESWDDMPQLEDCPVPEQGAAEQASVEVRAAEAPP